MLRSITPVLLSGSLLACGGGSGAVAPIVVTPANGATPVADPHAIERIDEGERRIGVAAGDCAAACSGLATITRARVSLCAPRTSACADAERREDAARRQVAAFCESCPSMEAGEATTP